MSIIAKLKSVLFGGGRDRDRGTRVAVEQEPATESERAVKESPPEPTQPEAEPSPATAATEEPAEPAEPEPTSESDEPVESITGIGEAYAGRLAEVGVTTVGELAVADAADLAETTDIAEGRIEGWIEQARDR